MSRPLNVALVQQRCGENPIANLTTQMDDIRRAAAGGARLVLLQELHNTP
jgi:N-carbamoylputrescine amidase